MDAYRYDCIISVSYLVQECDGFGIKTVFQSMSSGPDTPVTPSGGKQVEQVVAWVQPQNVPVFI